MNRCVSSASHFNVLRKSLMSLKLMIEVTVSCRERLVEGERRAPGGPGEMLLLGGDGEETK